MTNRNSNTANGELLLAELLEQISVQLQTGEPVDLDDYKHQFPEVAEHLEQLLPAVELLANLGGRPRTVSCSVVSPPAEHHDAESSDSQQVRELGDFRILREIGRGGMGVVYAAEQLSLGRHVALKVFPFAAVLAPKQLERFKNEAQAAARLHHSNIVGVHCIGSERGVHYFAMDLVEGHSLAELLEMHRESPDARIEKAEQQQSAAVSPSGGAWSETARMAAASTQSDPRDPRYCDSVAHLAVQAAEALDYAHQIGIVHRDVKPSNLLVDKANHLWVTDFGLAMTQTEANLTMSGDLLGTLRYMSPEQTAGRRTTLDHRTDIYSLGATLYELVTLQPAFTGDDRQTLLRQIRDVQPPLPRRLRPSIPVDLETIILKAISKEPDSRYATAQEMADDLRRFLENKPIVARRPSLVSRVSKWARRNSVLLTAIAATLVLSLSLSTGLLWREQRKTAAALGESEANWNLARQAVDDMYTQVAEQWLEDQPHMTQVQQDLLAKAAAFYENLPPQRRDDPALRSEAAMAHLRAGRIRGVLGQYDKAAPQVQRSVRLYRLLCADYRSGGAYATGMADALSTMGRVLDGQGKLDQAVKAYEDALEIYSRVAMDDTADGSVQGKRIRVQILVESSALGSTAESKP